MRRLNCDHVCVKARTLVRFFPQGEKTKRRWFDSHLSVTILHVRTPVLTKTRLMVSSIIFIGYYLPGYVIPLVRLLLKLYVYVIS